MVRDVTAPTDLILGLAWESWGGPRRGEGFLTSDRFAQSVLADERLGRILIVNAARSAPSVLVRRLTGQRHAPVPRSDSWVTTPLRLRRQAPAAPSDVERSMRSYVRQVEWWATRRGLQNPVVISSNPLVAGFAQFDFPVTYFAFDDWLAHPRFAHLSDAIEVAYKRLAASGRRVAAVSETLLERIAPTGASVVVPNGLDREEWLETGPEPTWLAPVSGPRAVYVGGLDERMDVELLTNAIEQRPDVSFVLVGNGHDQGPYPALGERANVTVHAPVDRAELTALVAACDVGLVPHRRNDLTRSMSPLKVYEYLAAGLPVAAVDLEPMRAIDDRVVLAEPDGFASAIDRAVTLGTASDEDRRRFIDDNDWASRHRRIVSLALGIEERSGT